MPTARVCALSQTAEMETPGSSYGSARWRRPEGAETRQEIYVSIYCVTRLVTFAPHTGAGTENAAKWNVRTVVARNEKNSYAAAKCQHSVAKREPRLSDYTTNDDCSSDKSIRSSSPPFPGWHSTSGQSVKLSWISQGSAPSRQHGQLMSTGSASRVLILLRAVGRRNPGAVVRHAYQSRRRKVFSLLCRWPIRIIRCWVLQTEWGNIACQAC